MPLLYLLYRSISMRQAAPAAIHGEGAVLYPERAQNERNPNVWSDARAHGHRYDSECISSKKHSCSSCLLKFLSKISENRIPRFFRFVIHPVV